MDGSACGVADVLPVILLKTFDYGANRLFNAHFS